MAFQPDTYSALADLSRDVVGPRPASLGDLELIEAQRALGAIRRRVDAASAAIAAEIAHRSRPELGHDGLAQRLGARSPALLIQHVTGATAREAQTMVRVGSILENPDAGGATEPPTHPWLADVARAVTRGEISLEAGNAIRAGLGHPTPEVTEAALADAARSLLRAVAGTTVEALASLARSLRSDLEFDGVRDREQLLRDKRYLILARQADGMTRLSGLLDPESAGIVTAAFDAITSPRRGGPRFIEAAAADRAEQVLRDERTTEQLALDGFVELVRIASSTDAGTVLGADRPAVRVLVTRRDLQNGTGCGRIEGQSEPVSLETVERHICEAGTVGVLFDDNGQAVNVGRDQRLFTRRQRVGLAARDGGCRFPRCERPVSWTEAHHIHEWHRDGGRTDIADGILLCRHHHLLVHNNGWRVTRVGGDYAVTPPTDVDSARAPIPAPSKSAALRRLLATATG